MTGETVPRPTRRGVLRRYQFVIVAIVGFAAATVPIASVAEVGWAGGPARYCQHTGLSNAIRGGDPIETHAGMIGCFGGRPDYLPALPFYIGGGLLALIGLAGAVTRTVQMRRGTAED